MKKIYAIALGLGLLFAGAISCQKDKANLKYESESLQIPAEIPDYAAALSAASKISNPFSNPSVGANVFIDNNTAFLGRVLFYDKKMSINNTVACGSCHHQENGFADTGAQSVGFNGGLTSRNSMCICNTAISKGFFWDKRVNNIKDLVLAPVRNHIEMGMESSDDLVQKITKVSYYPGLFEKAFGSKNITKENIAEALTQFLNSMVSVNSRHDAGMKTKFANFTDQEKKGEKLFTQTLGCDNCHSGTNLNNPWSEESSVGNIGLDMNYTDKGIENLNQNGGFLIDINNPKANVAVEGVFKVPSLRNIAQTGPYMHDGRFKTLEEVVEHYNSGIKMHPNLDWNFIEVNKNPNSVPTAKKFNLKKEEKEALVAFLKTFSDDKYMHDPKYSNPFLR